MKTYTKQDILRLGKRHNNKKRTYLLVNPLQSKHIPAIPSQSLSMMNTLGEKIAAKYPNAKLVIGFAETATAIGAAVATCLDDNCIYIHTTREKMFSLLDWIEFEEEHSHAVEQKLYAQSLGSYISDTSEIILVDDEISTGKTLINIIDQLCKKYPEVKHKKLVAASIINRVTPKNTKRLMDKNIECEYLIKLSETDYTNKVKDIEISSPISLIKNHTGVSCKGIYYQKNITDPRLGVIIHQYIDSCNAMISDLLPNLKNILCSSDNVLIVGTEEFMYPAIRLASEIENSNLANSVKCHATTRSPIGINNTEDYPARNGYKIASFYEENRETYIYNLTKYDKVFILTDGENNVRQATTELTNALACYGNNEIYLIRGGRYV